MAIQGECIHKQYVATRDVDRIKKGNHPIVKNNHLYLLKVEQNERGWFEPKEVLLTQLEANVCEPVLTEQEQAILRFETLLKSIDEKLDILVKGILGTERY